MSSRSTAFNVPSMYQDINIAIVSLVGSSHCFGSGKCFSSIWSFSLETLWNMSFVHFSEVLLLEVLHCILYCSRVLSTGEGGGEASTPNTISSPKTNEILEEINY